MVRSPIRHLDSILHRATQSVPSFVKIYIFVFVIDIDTPNANSSTLE